MNLAAGFSKPFGHVYLIGYEAFNAAQLVVHRPSDKAVVGWYTGRRMMYNIAVATALNDA